MLTLAPTRLLRAALLAGLTVWAALPVGAACPELMQTFQAAAARQDLDALTSLYERAETFESRCSGRELATIGDHLALAYGLQAAQAMRASAPARSVDTLLARAFTYGRPWRLLALSGDYYKGIKDYDRAARDYQEALNGLDELRARWGAPEREAFSTLYRRAAQMRGLARAYVAAPSTRSGAPGGVWLGLRDLVVSSVPVPVQFAYNADRLTPLGRQYADELFAFLTEQGFAEATLVGHTDPKGDACYNLRLSRQRAEALARYLKDRGYGGRVRVVARGEADPLSFHPDEGFSQDEQYRLMRRVELWLDGAPPADARCR